MPENAIGSTPPHKHLHDLRIVMVEEEAFACVESGDLLHVIVAEGEIE
jgi:hypothetical protein